MSHEQDNATRSLCSWPPGAQHNGRMAATMSYLLEPLTGHARDGCSIQPPTC